MYEDSNHSSYDILCRPTNESNEKVKLIENNIRFEPIISSFKIVDSIWQVFRSIFPDLCQEWRKYNNLAQLSVFNALREYLHFCFETWLGQRGGGLNAIRVGKNLVALALSRDESSILDRDYRCRMYFISALEFLESGEEEGMLILELEIGGRKIFPFEWWKFFPNPLLVSSREGKILKRKESWLLAIRKLRSMESRKKKYDL